MRIFRLLVIALSISAASGCGKPTLYPVVGQVVIGAKPASGVRVFFWPSSANDSTPSSRFGMGFTDEDGRFNINCGLCEEGIERGSYRVTFSRPLSKGQPITKKDRPNNVVESVPMPYSDHGNPENSPITVYVPASDNLVIELPQK